MVLAGCRASSRERRKQQPGAAANQSAHANQSSSPPCATRRNVPSGNGRCSLQASFQGADSHASTSPGTVKIAGIALGGIAPTSRFGSVVRNANSSHATSPSATFRVHVQPVQMPAKKASGRLSSKANHTGTLRPSGSLVGSLKEVNGTMQRLAGPSQRRHLRQRQGQRASPGVLGTCLRRG